MKINYNYLQTGDLVLCTSLKPISIGIRIKEAGWFKAFDTKIATHVGIVVTLKTEFSEMKAIAEMMPGGLKINSFSDYLNNGYFGDRIVEIKRFRGFENPVVQSALNNQILTWWESGKKYDWNGVLEYVLPFLKDKSNRFYCSEMVEWCAINIASMDLIQGKVDKSDNVTPFQIQMSPLTSLINWSSK